MAKKKKISKSVSGREKATNIEGKVPPFVSYVVWLKEEGRKHWKMVILATVGLGVLGAVTQINWMDTIKPKVPLGTLPDIELAKAHKEYKKQNYRRAFSTFIGLAEKGNAIAMFYTGRMYLKGQGEKKDPEKAMVWFNRAFPSLKTHAEQGSSSAMYYFARMHSNGYATQKDYDKALHWHHKAANDGYSKAMFRIGEIYKKQQKYEDALRWLQKARGTGDSQAANLIREIEKTLQREV